MDREEKLKIFEKKKKEFLKLKQEKAKLDKAARAFEEKNKILFFGHPGKGYLGPYGTWNPTRPQNEAIQAFMNPIINKIVYEGGNRGGKTFLLTIFALAALRGKFPWEPEENAGWLWNVFGWKPPIKIRILGQDWKKHIKGVLIPKFDELVPESWGLEATKCGEIAISQYFDPVTKGVINIVSNESSSSHLEGWNGHLLLMDEPPDRDNWVACRRGLTDFRGKQIFTMTLLQQPWIENEIINRVDEDGNFDVKVATIHTTIYDNIGHGLSKEGVEEFAEDLNDEEKKSRLDGVPAYKSGIILKNFNRKKHVLDMGPNTIRPNWLIDIQIDSHPSKPQFILFIATCESNLKYVVHAIKGHGDGTWIGDQIVKAVKTYNMRVNTVYADPLSKAGQKNLLETEYQKIENVLARFGIPLYNAGVLKEAKDDGIIKINSLLKTVNGLVGLYFFKTVGEVIQKCSSWMYDDKGKPSKEDDDYPECLYRACLLDTDYYPPEEDEGEDDYRPQVSRNKFTGY